MGESSENKPKKHICAGLLAHVDSGKTTLAESILYLTGGIRKLGRVDHRNAFLDTYELERARGITIFSKQAEVELYGRQVCLMDTPGHVDFSAEMERTLQILDYAVLVISGADGVQAHDLTLWSLLRRYRIPTFLFINKMDQNGTDSNAIMAELTSRLSENCIDFTAAEDGEDFFENLAVCSEEALQEYLENGEISEDSISHLICARKVYPCYFGSALKLQGVEAFLDGFAKYSRYPSYPPEFAARVYKIGRDNQGNRLTYMKITGGALKVKMVLPQKGEGEIQEKVEQIRIYSGAGFRAVDSAEAGMVCAVTGPVKTYSGQGIGEEAEGDTPVLEPVLSYRIELPEGCDVHGTFLKLCQLEEEEPELHIVWDGASQEIHAKVMGEVQIDILKSMIRERYGIDVSFGTGSITYKETITGPAEGVGHFEPLRHYAEVHLLLEPLERGSGMVFDTDCSEDVLDKNWQRLILTHLEEKMHVGVLTGAEITDMKITLLTGRAHLKHTEGGDFRQATYRAVRQGLKCAESILLEPVYDFRLEIPAENVGRAMADITRMHGEFQPPQQQGEMSLLCGTAPVSEMRGYQTEVISYSRGRGKLFCTLKGYEPCHNAEEVISLAGYDSEKDTDNPTGSVFCAHGAGFVVPWNQVREYMHLESPLGSGEEKKNTEESLTNPRKFKSSAVYAAAGGWGNDKELEEIFTRTYGVGREERTGWGRNRFESSRGKMSSLAGNVKPKMESEPMDEYLLVDGYNIIFALEELRDLAENNIDGARMKLMDMLCNYQGYRKNTLILVFDAYKVEGGVGEVMKYHNIYVVFTKEAETADQYIEKTVHEIGKKYHVTVATSDALEQRIIWGEGASRMSAKGLWEEMEAVKKDIRDNYLEKTKTSGPKLFQNVDKDMAEYLEAIRLGRKSNE